MVYLRGPVPVRGPDSRAARWSHRLRDELNLMPGRRATLRRGGRGRCSPSKLRRWRGSLTGEAAGIVGTRRCGWRPGCRSTEPGGAGRAAPRRCASTCASRWSATSEGGGGGRFVDAGGGDPGLAGGAGPRARWTGAAGRRCRSPGWPNTASGWPICWPRARPTGGWPPTPCPRWARCAPTLEHPPPPGLRAAGAAAGRASSSCPRRRCPPTLTATLRPYQQRGVDWLAFLRRAGLGGVLADDMGLGKTLQALAVLRPGKRRWSSAPPACCPTGRPSWPASAPACRSAPTTAPAARCDPDADVVLTTYALLRLDAERCWPARGNRAGTW